MRQLVSLDGLDTAKRFRATEKGTQSCGYLALYKEPNLDVYNTDAYCAIGGGNASKAFQHAIFYHRNIYDWVSRMPKVPETHRVLLCEDAAQGSNFPGNPSFH